MTGLLPFMVPAVPFFLPFAIACLLVLVDVCGHQEDDRTLDNCKPAESKYSLWFLAGERKGRDWPTNDRDDQLPPGKPNQVALGLLDVGLRHVMSSCVFTMSW